jgi:hypothetical protein
MIPFIRSNFHLLVSLSLSLSLSLPLSLSLIYWWQIIQWNLFRLFCCYLLQLNFSSPIIFSLSHSTSSYFSAFLSLLKCWMLMEIMTFHNLIYSIIIYYSTPYCLRCSEWMMRNGIKWTSNGEFTGRTMSKTISTFYSNVDDVMTFDM